MLRCSRVIIRGGRNDGSTGTRATGARNDSGAKYCAGGDAADKASGTFARQTTFPKRCSTHGDGRPPTRSASPTQAAARPAFVPVTILPATPPLEVVLGQGALSAVTPGFDPATLRQLLAVLDEEPSC